MTLTIVRRFLNGCQSGLTFIAGLSVVAIVIMTTADAGGRYVLDLPLKGAYEVTESFFLVATVFLGLLYAYSSGAFIRVTFLVHRLGETTQIYVNYFVQSICILITLTLLIGSLWESCLIIQSGMTLGFLKIPAWPPYIIVCIGYAVLLLRMIVDLWAIKLNQSPLSKNL